MGTKADNYRELVEHLPDGIVVHDGVTVLFVNQEALRMAGAVAEAQVVGRPVADFIAPASQPQVRDRLVRVTQGRTVVPLVRATLLRLDGTEISVEVKTMPITYNGRPAAQTVVRDRTAQVQAEAALAATEDKFRRLVTVMQVGVLLQGPGAEILLCNPQALVLLGLTEDQLLGRTSFDPSWNVVHEDGSPFPGPAHPAPRALATGLPVRNVVMGVYRPVTGDRVWLNVDAVPLREPSGAVSQVVCTFIGITERKQAEDRVQKLLAEKDLILKEVHHRIKNNMGIVKGLLFLQAQAQEGTGAYPVLKDAENRIQSMMVLYDKLYRSGDFSRFPVRDYLPALVDEILSVLPGGPTVGLTVEVEDLILTQEQLQSLGILVNELLTNTMKYAFRGRPAGTIEVALVRSGTQAVLTCRDDGVGLPPGVDFGRSTGFGLSLVALMADSLGGTLRIDRARGTAFVLEFTP